MNAMFCSHTFAKLVVLFQLISCLAYALPTLESRAPKPDPEKKNLLPGNAKYDGMYWIVCPENPKMNVDDKGHSINVKFGDGQDRKATYSTHCPGFSYEYGDLYEANRGKWLETNVLDLLAAQGKGKQLKGPNDGDKEWFEVQLQGHDYAASKAQATEIFNAGRDLMLKLTKISKDYLANGGTVKLDREPPAANDPVAGLADKLADVQIASGSGAQGASSRPQRAKKDATAGTAAPADANAKAKTKSTTGSGTATPDDVKKAKQDQLHREYHEELKKGVAALKKALGVL